MSARVLWLSLIVALFCGCQTSKPLSFGLFSVREEELNLAKGLGVDFVVGPQNQEYAQRVRDAKLKLIATGEVSFKSDTILGYYLTDEPDLRGIAPARIRSEYTHAKTSGAKPVFLNLSSAYSIELFRDHCDIVMFDWYPVGWQPLETFYSQLRIARLAAGKKPFYAIVQAFNWSDFPQLMPAKSAHRLPTQNEVLAMTTWAAMNGAAGIAFYPGTNSLNENGDIASMIESGIRFVRTNESALRGARLWTDYPFVFPRDGDKYNAVSEVSIAVKVTSPDHSTGETFLIAANTTQKNIEVGWRPDFEESSSGELLEFSPLEVKIFKLKDGGATVQALTARILP